MGKFALVGRYQLVDGIDEAEFAARVTASVAKNLGELGVRQAVRYEQAAEYRRAVVRRDAERARLRQSGKYTPRSAALEAIDRVLDMESGVHMWGDQLAYLREGQESTESVSPFAKALLGPTGLRVLYGAFGAIEERDSFGHGESYVADVSGLDLSFHRSIDRTHDGESITRLYVSHPVAEADARHRAQNSSW